MKHKHTITKTELIDTEEMDDVILKCPFCHEVSNYEDETYFVGRHEAYCPACHNRFQFTLKLPVVISRITPNDDDLEEFYEQNMSLLTQYERDNNLI